MRSQESKKFGQTGSVRVIFNDTQFDAENIVLEFERFRFQH